MNTIIRDKLARLGLNGMTNSLEWQLQNPEAQQLSFDQRFGMLLDAETSLRDSRKIERLKKAAHFRYGQACLEDIDYSPRRKLDRDVVMTLATGEWLHQHLNLIITGPTGTGKSWLACAFGVQACRQGFTTYYSRATQLFENIALAQADGSLPKFRRQLIKTQLLIIDDIGLGGINADIEPDLLNIIDLQSINGSLLLTSQFPTEQWYDSFSDPSIADATLDRIIHRAHTIELAGESMRKLKGKNP
jgi:DNA replication protein DnaC